MIRTLMIRNVALIERITVQFHKGLLVLSGETGAGKSIIIDAVALILGGRADRELIRSGADRASVEAEFETAGNAVLEAVLEKEGIEPEGDRIVLYREVSRAGRNLCRINGIMVSVATLKEVAGTLLNLHGQSEHQFLADEEKHLDYLDLMGDGRHQELLQELREAYQVFLANHRAYARLVKMNENRDLREERIKRDLEEIRKTDIRPGEEKRLAEESRRLNQASRIHERLRHAYELIGNGPDGADSMHNLQTAIKELHGLSGEGEEFEKLAGQCENLFYELEEAVYQVSELNQRFEFDPNEQENIENRLESVRKILKKYGPTEEDVLQNRDTLEEEYRTLAELEEKIRKTGAEHKRLLAQYRAKAREATESRKRIAANFEQKMMKELQDLGMQQTVIEVAFEPNSGDKPIMPSPSGDDRIRFMISPNPGEPLKPMSKIASGGELSRLMLALKTIEAGRSGVATMIFDEIDTGISGQMAQAVAEKMISISRHQQVICISHLPQLAAAADHQYLVHKGVRDGRTLTEVHEMNGEERKDEIARMISGAEGITDNAKQYAGQMIEASGRKKAEI